MKKKVSKMLEWFYDNSDRGEKNISECKSVYELVENLQWRIESLENWISKQDEAIKEIAAFGVHDDRLGEKLIVALTLNMPTETEQLDAYAREKLADYKVPHAFIIADEFNYTATGKIEKHKLRKAFLDAEKK